MSKTQKKKAYKATKAFKKVMSNEGLLTKAQYKALTQGQPDELKGVPEKQMNYLLANQLIQEV
jgi:hypothetical protein